LDYPTVNYIRAKVHRMIAMHASPRLTDRRTDGRTDKRTNIMACEEPQFLCNAKNDILSAASNLTWPGIESTILCLCAR